MFDQVNQLSTAGVDDYRLASFDGSRLLIIGSFDLCYYHDVEITFTEVAFIRCPTYFREPRFREAGKTEDGIRFEIETDGGAFEIIAESAAVAVCKVYHYDRRRIGVVWHLMTVRLKGAVSCPKQPNLATHDFPERPGS